MLKKPRLKPHQAICQTQSWWNTAVEEARTQEQKTSACVHPRQICSLAGSTHDVRWSHYQHLPQISTLPLSFHELFRPIENLGWSQVPHLESIWQRKHVGVVVLGWSNTKWSKKKKGKGRNNVSHIKLPVRVPNFVGDIVMVWKEVMMKSSW